MHSRSGWWGLRLKIVAWSFVPTAMALVAVGLVSFYAFQQTTRDLLIERNRELVRLMADQLAGKLDEYTVTLSDLARTPAFTHHNLGEQQSILNTSSDSLVVFDGGVVVTDERGVVVAAIPERAEILGDNWSNRDYFREIVRTRGPVFSDVVKDGPGGASAIVIGVPISGPQNEFLGMAAGMFRLGATNVSSFYGDIVKLRIGESDDAHLNTYLVDQQGQVIYHTNSERMGTNLLQQEPVQNVTSGNFIDEFSRDERPGFLGNAGAIRSRDVDGKDIVAYFALVPGANWGLVSESSWGALLYLYRNYLILQSSLFVLGVLVPALVVGFGIRKITEPIYQLKAAAKEVAEGKLGQEIHVQTHDELEELVDQFNHMSVQLSQSYAALKEREERLALVMQGTNDGIWDWNLQTGQMYTSLRWKSMLGYAEYEVGDQIDEWRRLVHPEEVENVFDQLNAHLESDETLFQLEHRMRHKDGSYRWFLARGFTLRDERGKPYRMAGSHSDITQRKEAEEALRKAKETLEERVQERTRELATLNEISILVNRSLNLNEILHVSLDKTLDILNMEMGAAYRLEGEGGKTWVSPDEAESLSPDQLFLNPLAFRGPSGGFAPLAERLSLSESGLGTLIHTQEPLVWEVRASAVDAEIKLSLLKEGVEQVLSIPLQVKGRLAGVIQLGSCQVREYTPEVLDLLAAIGRHVGVAVENARLHQVVQQTVAIEERARLARELHDSVTQSLYSVTLLAEAAARLLITGESQTAADHLRELRDTAQESLREMRLLIYELRPVALENSRLADALRLRLEAVEARSGIKADLQVEGEERLSYETKVELYQIAQESLNNILKHSHAGQVRIQLQFIDGMTCLEVSDDGIGFNIQDVSKSGGLGLAGVAERAQKIGGRLQIDSAPGKGTRIRVEVGNPVISKEFSR